MLKLGIWYPDLKKFITLWIPNKMLKTSLSSPTFYNNNDKNRLSWPHVKSNWQKQIRSPSHIRWHRLLTYTTHLISFTYDTCTSFQHPPAVHHAGWMMMVYVCGPAKYPFFFLLCIPVTQLTTVVSYYGQLCIPTIHLHFLPTYVGYLPTYIGRVTGKQEGLQYRSPRWKLSVIWFIHHPVIMAFRWMFWCMGRASTPQMILNFPSFLLSKAKLSNYMPCGHVR